MNISSKGPFVIVSGPSGVGKTVFIQKSLEKLPQFANTVSYTTRSPREDEKDGDFYYFITKEQFEKMKEDGEFLEWAKVHNEFYATAKKEVERLWQKGRAIIKDVDVQGCFSIKKVYPHSVSVFIYPPSINELKNRILKRGYNTEAQMEKRLSKAAEEMARGQGYDFKIVNDFFEEAWEEFQKILIQSLKLQKI